MVGLGTKKLMCLGLLVAGCVRGADADQQDSLNLVPSSSEGSEISINALQQKVSTLQQEVESLRMDVGDFGRWKKEFRINAEINDDNTLLWPISKLACFSAEQTLPAKNGIENLKKRLDIIESQVKNQEIPEIRGDDFVPNLCTQVQDSREFIRQLEGRYAFQQKEKVKLQEQITRDRWVLGGLLAALGYKYKPEFTNVYNGAANSRLGNFVGTGCNKVGGISTKVVTGIGSWFSKFVPTKVAHVGGKFIDSHSQGLNIAGVVTGIGLMGHAAYRNYGLRADSSNTRATTILSTPSSSGSSVVKQLFSGFQPKKTFLSKEFIAGGLLTTVSALNLTGHTDARNTALLIGGAALTAKVAVDCGPAVKAYFSN